MCRTCGGKTITTEQSRGIITELNAIKPEQPIPENALGERSVFFQQSCGSCISAFKNALRDTKHYRIFADIQRYRGYFAITHDDANEVLSILRTKCSSYVSSINQLENAFRNARVQINQSK